MTTTVTNGAMKITIASTGEVFACNSDDSLLFAGLSQGIDLPYECSSGSCGSCKCQLLSGEVKSRWPDAKGLSERDRRKGNVILLCQSQALSDCSIKVKTRNRPDDIPRPIKLSGKIVARKQLTWNMVELVVGLNRMMDFLPGQYVLLKFGQRSWRAYSMSGTPNGKDKISLIIKAKPGGAVSEDVVESALPGDSVMIEGPYGEAYYRKESGRPIVAIGGGSGLAPVWSIAQSAANDGGELHLYFGVNEDQDVCYRDEFIELEKKSNNIKTHTIVMNGDVAHHRKGLVGDCVGQDFDSLKHSDVYMAGPQGMIDAILESFVGGDFVDASHVYFDRF